jgi:hypothetical protein
MHLTPSGLSIELDQVGKESISKVKKLMQTDKAAKSSHGNFVSSVQ